MKTFPLPPRMPTLPGPARVPSLLPPPAPRASPLMWEFDDERDDDDRDTVIPPPSRLPSAYPRYPSAPPSSLRGDVRTDVRTEVRADEAPPSSRRSSPPSSRRSSPPRRSVPPAFFGVVAAAMMPACSVATRSEPPPATEGAPLTLSQLDITEGSIREGAPGHLRIGAPKVRAVAAVEAGDAAELRFVYRGPTAVQVALDGGEMRHQVGIKLRAQDGCNVVYVMWEIKPTAKLSVRFKHNPGVHTSAECGASGYRSIAPTWSADAPILRSGEAHALAASIEDGMLYVRIDGKVVWQGEATPEMLSLHGPLGMRTDNVELEAVALVPTARQATSPVLPRPPPTAPPRPK